MYNSLGVYSFICEEGAWASIQEFAIESSRGKVTLTQGYLAVPSSRWTRQRDGPRSRVLAQGALSPFPEQSSSAYIKH